jgi:glycosyltransferase involved in cell wall biosynthesis
MRVSVFTPTHNPRWLDDCYRSLAAQTLPDWEWVVLLNGKAGTWAPPQPDPRVRVERAGVKGVGAAKRAACELATGDLLVELDHDDVLVSDCLETLVVAADVRPNASLLYSDFAQINDDGSPNSTMFNLDNGWEYTPCVVDGVEHLRCHAMRPSPHNVGYIWYAPNHVRAFRRTAYEAVGGYDASLHILDDQDLMTRLYLHGEFVHIDKLLYLQRWHPRNTQVDPKINAEIQERTVEFYRENIDALALAWAGRAGLATIILDTPTSVGKPDVDPRFAAVRIDPAAPALPYADDSVGVIKLLDVLQRAPDRAALFNECYRVLAHGGLLLTDTPSTDGRGAFQDPSHVAFYNENSFAYLTQMAMRATIPTLTARLQLSHLLTYWPSETHERMDIPYVKANLLAIKDGPRQGGPLQV